LDESEKPGAIREALRRHAVGDECSLIFVINPDSFRQIPGCPFAYWVSENVRKVFTAFPAFENPERSLRQGLGTSDDFRFVKGWWEVPPTRILSGTERTTPALYRHETQHGKGWVPIVKAGVNKPFYTDLSMVALWDNDGKEMKDFAASLYRQSSRTIKNTEFYFRPGITWPSRPWLRGFFSIVPPGALFTVSGMMLFSPDDTRLATCGILNSDAYAGLLHLLMARGIGAETDQTLKYEVGYLSAVPLPTMTEDARQEIETNAARCYELVRTLDTNDETTHSFVLPAALVYNSESLSEAIGLWRRDSIRNSSEMAHCMQRINAVAYSQYGIAETDRSTIELSLALKAKDAIIEQEDVNEEPLKKAVCFDLISYFVGCIVGRWDVRFALRAFVLPRSPSLNHPLAVCSPGMLQSAEGSPLTDAPVGYPLLIDSDGTIPDDLGHTDDIVGRVEQVLELICRDRAGAIETEACEILGVKELRDYFRKPGVGGFWDDHIKRYSKSRRKAPIYWLLQSSKKNYALWLYYHRLDKDILFKALTNYVEPKVRLEESRLAALRSRKQASGEASKGSKKLDKEIEKQEDFLSELRDFEDKLRRAANLHLEPDLNDGVVLNIAPLWELVPWKEAKKYWDDLMKGEYEWSSIGKQLREKGLVKC
jgi:hypothetical protein